MPVIRSARRVVAGYALLEALVAVIVTSIGFIGAARLQTLGLTFNNSTLYRQKATLLGSQMSDRMRANQKGVASGAYDDPGSPPPEDAACLTTGCTPAGLARADVAEWLVDVARQLPDGSAVVCVDSTPDDGEPGAPACDNLPAAGGTPRPITIKLWWSDALGTSRFVTIARP